MILVISLVQEEINDRKTTTTTKSNLKKDFLSMSNFPIYSILQLQIAYACVLTCDLGLHIDCFSLLSVSIMLICLKARNSLTSSQSFFHIHFARSFHWPLQLFDLTVSGGERCDLPITFRYVLFLSLSPYLSLFYSHRPLTLQCPRRMWYLDCNFIYPVYRSRV